MFILGKIKTYIIAALSLALPIIYVMGRAAGGAKEKNKVLLDELESEQKSTNFYKAMLEHEEDNITDRDSLINRLRNNGL
jgi:hypothetical protein|tara:strand:- start:149 stop:388 length:240 start_codon:yes stop_codon:yes gene_type:complete